MSGRSMKPTRASARQKWSRLVLDRQPLVGSVQGIERVVMVSASTSSCSARFWRTCQAMTGGV